MHVTINERYSKSLFISCYAPTLPSTDAEKENFYSKLREVAESVPQNVKLIIAGDFNARVGKDHHLWKGALGKHGVGKKNENGHLLLQFCMEKHLTLVNTMFYLKNKHKTTWKHPRSNEWHTLDYILVRSKDIQSVIRCRVFRGANCDTDHRLLKAEIKWNRQRFHKSQNKSNFNFQISLLKDEQFQQRFKASLTNEIHTDMNDESMTVETMWTNFKDSFLKAANNTLPKKKHERRDWYDENIPEIFNILEEKKKAHEKYISQPSDSNKLAYKTKRAECQKLVRIVKQKW